MDRTSYNHRFCPDAKQVLKSGVRGSRLLNESDRLYIRPQMTIEELRVEALRAAVAIETKWPNPNAQQVAMWANVYLKFICTGEVPREALGGAKPGAANTAALDPAPHRPGSHTPPTP